MGGGGGGGGAQKQKLMLEDYTDFFNDVGRFDLTINKLNEIIFMHGFIRMHRRNKMDIMKALRTMDLMDPNRSTLRDGACTSSSPPALLTVGEVRSDLESIGWEECPVGSLQVIGTQCDDVEENGCRLLTAIATEADFGRSSTATGAAILEKKRKRDRAPRGRPRSARKVRSVASIDSIPLLTQGPVSEF